MPAGKTSAQLNRVQARLLISITFTLDLRLHLYHKREMKLLTLL